MKQLEYKEFLNSKNASFEGVGFKPSSLNKYLFPFQKAIVEWALQKGKAAIFSDCGTGKTIMELAWADAIIKKTNGNILIVTPLSVSYQTIMEGKKFHIEHEGQSRDGSIVDKITITNYEMLEKFNPEDFIGIVIDESSIIKNFDGKTRNLIISKFNTVKYKLACTATPSPNDFMELGNHSEFLGIMTYTEMLSKYFFHDGGETSKWVLKGHAEQDFWKWICSWAVMIRKPSDIGFSDEGYNLPKLNTKQIIIPSNIHLTSGDNKLFTYQATTLEDQRQIKKETIGIRIEECAKLVNNSKEQWIVWCGLNSEGDQLEKLIKGSIQVSGKDSIEDKEERLNGFITGKYRVLITKKKIGAFGLNLQNCHNMVFCFTDHSYELTYQAIRREWRFGQKHEVNVYFITVDIEGPILQNLKRKELDAKKMQDGMLKYMKLYQDVFKTVNIKDEYKEKKDMGKDWEMILGDSVEKIKDIPNDSIHYSIFSPPFASLYTYSNSMRDMGNSKDMKEFTTHFKFLVKELFRVVIPGRLLSFHCMNLPMSLTHDGVIGINDFRGTLIQMFIKEGWIFHSEVVIWKDPVMAMQRTKALGLLHKQIKKDSARCRQGIPDYLVTMRKPGLNPNPVKHTNETFSVNIWQKYASPVWFDINPSNTLQKKSAREEKDEKHICPLQLQVIERAIQLWTNPNDLILDPFTGIGSTGYVSLLQERKFIGIELKESYYEQAVSNLKAANKKKGMSLIGASLFNE
jgi:DNA modification methylase